MNKEFVQCTQLGSLLQYHRKIPQGTEWDVDWAGGGETSSDKGQSGPK